MKKKGSPTTASGGTSVPHYKIGRLTLPRKVRQRETSYIDQRRQAKGVGVGPIDVAAPLVGLSFSGGGIRSATFCLGILQTLGRTNVLRLADYLCTVSGGGYLGACLSSLMTRKSENPDAEQHDELQWKEHAGDGIGPTMPLLCTDQIHHLRKHGDFLLLGQGVVNRELLRSIGQLVTGWIGSFGLFLLLVLTCAAAFMAYTSGLAGSDLWRDILDKDFAWPKFEYKAAVLPLLAGTAVGLVGNLWIATRRRKKIRPKVEAGETAEDRRERYFIRGFKALLLLTGILVTLILPALSERTTSNLIWTPSFFIGSFVAATCFYLLCSHVPRWWNHSTRTVYAATAATSLIFVIGSLVLLGVVWFTGWLDDEFPTWLASIGGVSGLASRLLSRISKRPTISTKQSSTVAFALGVIRSIVLALSVAIFLLSVFTLCVYLLATRQVNHVYLQMMASGAALLLFCLWGFLIDFNRIGIHYFYRDRLSETYLRTEARSDGRLKRMRDDSALLLKDLHTWNKDGSYLGNPAPYHLILSALNLAGSKDLTRKDRKSDHFLFSREYCGSTTTGYMSTKDYRRGRTKLATAMTISGAAASSGMGFYTSILQAFTTTLFNIRLGFWLVNPRIYDDENDKVVYSGHATRPNAWSKELAGRKQFGMHARTWHERFTFWPICLYRESTLSTTSRSALINLSDGGHTGDNIGLYPLFQRRCKLIIACDGEADPGYEFGSLANAIGQIYTDENVQVHVDLDQLRPDKTGEPAKQHYLIGRIEYPPSTSFTIHESLKGQLDKGEVGGDDTTDSVRSQFKASQMPLSPEAKIEKQEDGKRWIVVDQDAKYEINYQNKELRVTDCRDTDREASTGWLIYLKSSLVNERQPATVASYAAKEPFFPHQTVADQLFEDEQFEAYRMLGEHIAETMLADARIASEAAGTAATTTGLIDWCKQQWRPSRVQLLAASQECHADVEAMAERLGCDVSVVKEMLAEQNW